MSQVDKTVYRSFLEEIKQRVLQSQHQALRAVNTELINLYWSIGQAIVEKQEELGWGKSVVETLAEDLQNEFPGTKGLSARNLWRMKAFYEQYHGNEKLPPLVAEIGWSHNVVIMEKCNDDLEREFYIKMTKKYGWSKNILTHQIEGKAYERAMTGQTNFDKALEERYQDQGKLAVKDNYSFDFLDMGQAYSEHELEINLIKNIRKFLLEMGGDFAFMGNQYKLVVGGDEFFIDLLLYHRKLRALVAIELKITKFKPEYAGQLQFYLTALDEQVKEEDENPSIGIIICKDKDRTTVEYALKNMNSPMGIATYSIQEELPDDMKNLLPSPDEIAERLENLLD